MVKTIPWIQVYKPKKIKDIRLNVSVYSKLHSMVETKKLENCLFVGPSGVGKTTAVTTIAHELYDDKIGGAMLTVQGTDDRGIKVVQDTIVSFCKKKVDLNGVDRKLIVIDEADHMPINTQQLINTLLEEYSETTRFIFTATNSAKIIEGIQSRCSIIIFPYLNSEQIIERLQEICDDRGIEYDYLALKAIDSVCQGDMRNGINTLQLIHAAKTKLTEKNVFLIIHKPHPDEMKRLLLMCLKGELKNAIEMLDVMKEQGYSPIDTVLSMLYTLRTCIKDEMQEKDKIRFLNQISQTCMVISRGVGTDIQLTASICALCGYE